MSRRSQPVGYADRSGEVLPSHPASTFRLPLPRLIAGPKAVIVLLVIAVALCLGTLVYVEHTNSRIVDQDMQTAVALSEIASSFDHADGDLYRMMVDEAANGRSAGMERQIGSITRRVRAISSALSRQEHLLAPHDQRRVADIRAELDKYDDAVGVVSSMLELDFKTSVAMLRPFRANADHVLAEIKGIAASGIADARAHAEAAAWHTRLLVVFVTIAVLVVAGLSYAWLVLAAERGVQLGREIELRSEAEQEALVLARTDALTGLVNRRVFVAELEATITKAIEIAGTIAIVLIDLDGFKQANDVHGHAAGDAVLHTVAYRLKAAFSPHGLVARLGGDEFAVFIDTRGGQVDVRSLAEQASGSLQQPFAWRDNAIRIGASTGVSRFPEDGRELGELLHAADIAMYEAKREKKGGVCLFAPEMEIERLERRQMEQELRIGIRDGEIRPFYQPIVRFSDQGLCGFEVLARWHHPRLGLLTPDAFIRLAETTGQITDLTKSVLNQACVDLLQMPAHLRLAVNISPMQLEEPGLAESLIEIIHSHGVSPTRIEIEITEDAVMDDIANAERVIQTFRSEGISIALDDFGTDYSSLSNLRRLKFDKIKIDQSFIKSLPDSAESGKLVDAIISLALSFGMKVTAEGIEDAATANVLIGKGCTQGQGYFFGKPLSYTDSEHGFFGERQQAA